MIPKLYQGNSHVYRIGAAFGRGACSLILSRRKNQHALKSLLQFF